MNENEEKNKLEGVHDHAAEQAAQRGPDGGSRAIRGDGSATLERVQDRRNRLEKKLIQVDDEINRRISVIQERRRRAEIAKKKAAGIDHAAFAPEQSAV